jgi:hypothetical protein
MILVLRLLPNQRCEGCAAIGRVHDLTRLCLSCLAPWIHVEERKEKLNESLRHKFAWPVEKIAQFRREFQR